MKKYFDNVFVFLALTLVFQAIITFLLTQMANPASAILSQFSFTAESFSKIVNNWNNLDRSIFLTHYLFDFIYPFIYGRFFYLAIKYMLHLKYSDEAFRLVLTRALFLPAIATVCDLTENTFHLLMVGQHIPISDDATFLAAFCASVKWGVLFICSLVLILTYISNRRKKAV